MPLVERGIIPRRAAVSFKQSISSGHAETLESFRRTHSDHHPPQGGQDAGVRARGATGRSGWGHHKPLRDPLRESGSERSELPESLKAHQQRFARAPHLLAADRGLYSVENERLAQEAGVKRVAALPKSGKLSEERKRHEKQRWFSGEASALGRASREHPRKGLGPSKYLGRINRQCRSRIQPKQWAPYYCTIG